MSTDNIYRSVVINTNEEVLVYKNVFGEYKDLRSKRTFLENELENFISLSRIIGITANTTLNCALKMYYENKYEDLYFHSTYIGDIGLVVINEEYSLDIEVIEENKVFAKRGNEYIDLASYEMYTDNNIEVGEKVIVNHKLIKECFNEELTGSKQPKNKVLRLCQERFRDVG